jgi:glycosyltransferase involved in cell wall biosynthesis
LFFSIIIPFFNKQNSIELCLKSVLVQKIQSFEIIIINDYSDSDITNYVEYLVKDLNNVYNNKITLYNNLANFGPGFSRNRGIELSKGEVLIFLDADDLFTENYLKDVDDVFCRFNTSVVISSTIEKKDNLIRPNYNNLYTNGLLMDFGKNLFKTKDFVAAFCKDPIFCGCGNVAIRKSTINHIRFSEIDMNYEDWLFFYQICTVNHNNIIFLNNKEGIVYDNTSINSLSRKNLLFENVKFPLFLNQNEIDFRFRKYIYFNWLYSTLQRITSSWDRIKIIRKHFKIIYFDPFPIWKFFYPSILLLFNLDYLVSKISKLRKLLIYDN